MLYGRKTLEQISPRGKGSIKQQLFRSRDDGLLMAVPLNPLQLLNILLSGEINFRIQACLSITIC